LDIGTTSICGVLLNASNKEIVHAITKPNNASMVLQQHWAFAQDPESIMDTICELISELSPPGAAVQGIGVTGQMHGILYVDGNGRAVSPLFTWQDKRGDLPCHDGVTYTEQLARLTGYPVASGYGMVTHFYQLSNGLVPPETAALCTIPDYVAMRLANRTSPHIDATNAASLGLFHLEVRQFDSKALAAASMGPDLLPELLPSGTVIGHTADAIPVACAVGDNQASFLGAVRDIRASILMNIGTGSQTSVYSEDFRITDRLDTRPFPGGGYLLVGASLSGGKSYALLEQFFREVCSVFTGNIGDSFYETMNRLAEDSLPEAPGLHVNTQFFGTRQDPQKRGLIGNIGPAQFTPQHLVHGFLDGMMDELHRFYEAYPAPLKQRLNRLVASGNGVRRNPALCRKLERAFGLPLEIPKHREESSYGAALCAGVGTGLYPDFFHL
jgi:sedoheptulokinase